MAQDWYYKMLGEETGPFTFEALRDLARAGHLASDDDVRTSTSDWRAAEQVPGLIESGEDEEPEPATDLDLDLMLAPSADTQTMQVSPKRKAQRAAIAAAAAPPATEWYYQLLGQELGPTTQGELLQMIQSGSLHGEDAVRQGPRGAWKRLDKTAPFATVAVQMRPKAEWYCRVLGQELGPMTFDELQQMAQTGAVHADDEVRLGSSEPWDKAGRTRGLKCTPVETVAAASHDRSATLVPFGEAAHKREWYYEILGQRMGPISFKVLAQAVSNGTLSWEDKARRGQTGAWSLVMDVPGLLSSEDKAAYFAAKLEATRPKVPAPISTPAPVAAVVSRPPVAVAASAVPRAEQPQPAVVTPAAPSRPAPTGDGSSTGSTAYGTTGSTTGGYGSMATASRPAAFPPRPAFTPPKKSSGPAFDFGAMLSDLKGSIDTKAIAAIAVLLLMGGYFGMSLMGISLSGTPGKAEYQAVRGMWDEVQQLHQKGDKPSDWDTFRVKHESELKQLVVQINKQNPASDKPLLQSMLTCTREHLPGMLSPDRRGGIYKAMEQAMSDAAAMVGDQANVLVRTVDTAGD